MHALKGELDLFTETPTQVSVESGKWVSYKPLSSLRGDSPIEFNIPGGSDEYLDLPLTLLYLKVKITCGDSALNDKHKVGPVNNFLHSLFDHAEVSLNGCLLSPAASNYAYRSYIETLLNYGREAKNSHLTASMWQKDTPGQMESLTNNVGYGTRKSLISKSKEFELFGNLCCDIMNVNKFLLNGVDLRVKLSRNKAQFALMGEKQTDDGGDFKIVITDASLLVRKVKIAPKILLAHEAALQHGTAKYAYTKTETKIFTISSDILNTSLNNVYLGHLPTRIIIGLVSHKAYNSELNKNPFNFHHFNLNYLSLFLDSEQIPSKPLRPDFENQTYVQAYYTLFSGSGIFYQDDGNDISLADYPKGFTFYSFDLTNDHSASQTGHWNPVRNGQLRIDLGFAKAVPETLSCIVFSEFQSSFHIDKNRNVAIDSPI